MLQQSVGGPCRGGGRLRLGLELDRQKFLGNYLGRGRVYYCGPVCGLHALPVRRGQCKRVVMMIGMDILMVTFFIVSLMK